MNSFELSRADSGDWTVQHVKSGVMVHSAVNPVQEAERMVTHVLQLRSTRVLYIGNGLGYFSDAMMRHGQNCICLEVFGELIDICSQCGKEIPCLLKGSNQLEEVVASMPSDTRVIVAPYVMALRDQLPVDLGERLAEIHVVDQSRRVYSHLIDDNMNKNRSVLPNIPRFCASDHYSNKIAIAVGSGPTLDASLPIIKEWQRQLLIVAASGAVPILIRHEIIPDWVVAMEARSTVCGDLHSVDNGSKILVFPWTHPDALSAVIENAYVAYDEDGIATNGGSTGLAAADLAAKLSTRALFMIGMDMSDQSGEYSAGARRETGNLSIRAPKFQVMRSAASHWAGGRANRKLFHMIMPGNSSLNGFSQLYPMELETEIVRDLRAHVAMSGSRA